MQIILPHFKQLGALVSSGCRAPIHEQRRASAEGGEIVGFVVTSKARIAESRSASVEEAPCIGVPPVMETFAEGACFAGEAVRGVDDTEVFDEGGLRDGEALRVCTFGSEGSRYPLKASVRCDEG
jgi:hypothetical protein